MILIVIACPGIGKTTISSNNKFFMDLDKKDLIADNIILKNTNKIILINYIELSYLRYKLSKNNVNNYKILVLDVSCLIKNLKQRVFIRVSKQASKQTNKIQILQKYYKDIDNFLLYFKKVKNDKKIMVKKLTTITELNNLENILLEEYNKLNA